MPLCVILSHLVAFPTLVNMKHHLTCGQSSVVWCGEVRWGGAGPGGAVGGVEVRE